MASSGDYFFMKILLVLALDTRYAGQAYALVEIVGATYFANMHFQVQFMKFPVRSLMNNIAGKVYWLGPWEVTQKYGILGGGGCL